MSSVSNDPLVKRPTAWDILSHGLGQNTHLPRLAEPHVATMLQTQLVTVLMGACPTGKSTLVAESPSTQGFTRLTLNDLDARRQALNNPESLLVRAEPLAIDEVQRALDLLIAIKRAAWSNPPTPLFRTDRDCGVKPIKHVD